MVILEQSLFIIMDFHRIHQYQGYYLCCLVGYRYLALLQPLNLILLLGFESLRYLLGRSSVVVITHP